MMGGNELIVAFFALAFLAFCLTAVALYALSQNKEDVAESSVDALKRLQMNSLPKPKPEEMSEKPSDDITE